MYLSNRDIKWAIDCGKLIVEPRPEALKNARGQATPQGYDETSIDLHLGPLSVAKIWDLKAIGDTDKSRGFPENASAPELRLGAFDWETFKGHLKDIPEGDPDPENQPRKVYKRGDEVIVRPLGFILWATKERVGTPKVNLGDIGPQTHPELICFVNAKSTKARTGLIVHFTAPTIHAGWAGNVTLEISNLGPFTFVLREDDALAQLTVATISSAPDLELKSSKSKTQGQRDPSGTPRPS